MKVTLCVIYSRRQTLIYLRVNMSECCIYNLATKKGRYSSTYSEPCHHCCVAVLLWKNLPVSVRSEEDGWPQFRSGRDENEKYNLLSPSAHLLYEEFHLLGE